MTPSRKLNLFDTTQAFDALDNARLLESMVIDTQPAVFAIGRGADEVITAPRQSDCWGTPPNRTFMPTSASNFTS